MRLLSTTTAPGTLLPGGTGHSFSLPRWSGDHSSAGKGACLGSLCQTCIKLKEERERKGSEVGGGKDRQRRDSFWISHPKGLPRILVLSKGALVASRATALSSSQHTQEHDRSQDSQWSVCWYYRVLRSQEIKRRVKIFSCCSHSFQNNFWSSYLPLCYCWVCAQGAVWKDSRNTD